MLLLEHNNQYLSASQGSWSSVVKQWCEGDFRVCPWRGIGHCNCRSSGLASEMRDGRHHTGFNVAYRVLEPHTKPQQEATNLLHCTQLLASVNPSGTMSLYLYSPPWNLLYILYTNILKINAYMGRPCSSVRMYAWMIQRRRCCTDMSGIMYWGNSDLILLHVSPTYEMQVENYWLQNAQSMWYRYTNFIRNTSICGSRHSTTFVCYCAKRGPAEES
jgi:hypothetical protein